MILESEVLLLAIDVRTIAIRSVSGLRMEARNRVVSQLAIKEAGEVCSLSECKRAQSDLQACYSRVVNDYDCVKSCGGLFSMSHRGCPRYCRLNVNGHEHTLAFLKADMVELCSKAELRRERSNSLRRA